MITGARVPSGVIDDEPVTQADQEIAEAFPDGVPAAPGLLEVDANAGLSERAVLIDQGDEGPLAFGYRGGQAGQVVKRLFRLGIQEPGRLHGGDPAGIRQRGREPVRPQPAGKHQSGYRRYLVPVAGSGTWPDRSGAAPRINDALRLHGRP